MVSEDVLIKIRVEIIKAQQNLRTLTKELNGFAKTKKRLNQLAQAQHKVAEAQENLRKQLHGKPFAGWALSIMFFGMALKQAFNTIWKSSSKTFNDIMHSTEGTVTGFDMLDGSLKYLGFTVGQALEPIAYFLLPIIDFISQWVTEHEKLVRVIVASLGIGGTILTGLGMGKLAYDGLAVAVSKAITPLTALTGLPSVAIVAIAAALIAIAAISWKAFQETPEAWDAVVSFFKEVTSGPLNNLKDSLKEIIQDIFGMQISWEDVAWMIAWSMQFSIAAFKKFVDSINMIIQTLDFLITVLIEVGNAYKGLQLIMSGRFISGFKTLSEIDRAALDNIVKDAEEAALSIAQVALNSFTLGGIELSPSAFKQNALNDQSASRQEIYIEKLELMNPANGQWDSDSISQLIAKEAQKYSTG